ncbi:MAG: NAD-dependent epimerase/dehydratase family protein [Rhodospirillales bacterium]
MTKLFLDSDIAEIARRLAPVYDQLSGKTVLLTGGGGFLGRHFMQVFRHLNEHCLKAPVKLTALDNFITAEAPPEISENGEHIRFIKHNVIEPYSHEGPLDYILHAAGIASPFYYRAYPLETIEVAVTGTKNMLRLAEQTGARFMFFSSSEVYGDPDPAHVPMRESYCGNVASQGPRACYDESKRMGETLCYVFHEMHGVQTSIVRPFNVYGPGMSETDYRVLPNFASRIKAGMPLNIYGSGAQTRTFCYITDAVVGFTLAMTQGVSGQTYNIGNPQPEISVLQLADLLDDVLGRKLDRRIVEYPDSYPGGEPMRRAPNIEKARQQLKFDPAADIKTGLKNFLDWADGVYTGRQ